MNFFCTNYWLDSKIFQTSSDLFLQTFFNNYQEKFKIGLKQLNKRKVKHEDWNLFQMCLTLMQTIGMKSDAAFRKLFRLCL